MSAVILDFSTHGNSGQSIAERVKARLPGFAPDVVSYAQVFAESYQRKTDCKDIDAVNAGVRHAKYGIDPEPPKAA